MENSNNCNDYLNVMAKNGVLPCNHIFTREPNLSKTCINHIFTNNVESNKIISHILRSGIIDNFATILMLSNLYIGTRYTMKILKKNIENDVMKQLTRIYK